MANRGESCLPFVITKIFIDLLMCASHGGRSWYKVREQEEFRVKCPRQVWGTGRGSGVELCVWRRGC